MKLSACNQAGVTGFHLLTQGIGAAEFFSEEKGPFLRTAKQADNVQRHALKREVASGHDLMADAVRHGKRHSNTKKHAPMRDRALWIR